MFVFEIIYEGNNAMKNTNLVTLNEPASFISESYKILRTNLNFLITDEPNQVVLFTSSTKLEGKSTTVANVAITFAQEGKKVLILECDLRCPQIYKLMNIQRSPGTAEVLSDRFMISEVIQKVSGVDNLDIITSGQRPVTPYDFQGSNKIESIILDLRSIYDIILIDAPPLLNVADTMVLSKYVDGIVLIVALHDSKIEDALKSKKELDKVKEKVLGIVLTKDTKKKKRYSYGYENEAKRMLRNKKRKNKQLNKL